MPQWLRDSLTTTACTLALLAFGLELGYVMFWWLAG